MIKNCLRISLSLICKGDLCLSFERKLIFNESQLGLFTFFILFPLHKLNQIQSKRTREQTWCGKISIIYYHHRESRECALEPYTYTHTKDLSEMQVSGEIRRSARVCYTNETNWTWKATFADSLALSYEPCVLLLSLSYTEWIHLLRISLSISICVRLTMK